MAEILEMYHSMSGCGLSDLQTVLQVINEHQALDSKQREKLTPLVSDITESLQRAGTRSRGLLTLQCLLQSSLAGDEILAEKGSSWMCFCVAALKAPRDQALAYNVIKLLLEKCSSVHELDRTVINASLPELTLSLAKCSPHSFIHALKCLETLLSRYSKASGGHKSAIEKFLLKFLDSKNKRDVMYAAKCAHLLQQVRGGGEQGINHKMAWRLQLDLLTEASSNILSSLYSQTIDSYGIGSIDYFNADADQNKQNARPEQSSTLVGPLTAALRDIEEENAAEDATAELGNPIIRKAIRRAVRLENLLVFIQAMLVDPFPVNKRISCRSVLSLLIRCQSAASGRPSPAGMEPSLHCAVSDTLRALTFCLKGNILPYSSLIMRMALQTLEWSRTKNQVLGIKPFKNVRKSAYAMLSTILRCVHTIRLPTQQGDQSFEDKIFENMLEDIVPHRVTIQLTVKSSSGGPVKNMSQKARRKMTMAQLEGSSIASHSPHGPNSKGEDSELANSDLTISALDCMDSLFVASGNFFKATTYQLVQENLIRMLYEVNQRSLAVKRGLTHTLMVVQQYSSTTCPSPIAHCLNLFSLGQHCGSLKLSAFAHSALNASLSSIRGAAPPLLIPKAVEQSTSTAEEKRKSVEQTKLMELLAAEEKNRKGLTNGDVIEVGESIDSASQGEDSQASEGEMGSKKRKRSGDRRLQNLVNSSNVISSPAGKRTKISESENTVFTVETQEISDNESEAADTTIVIDGNPSDDEVIFMDDEVPKVNGNDNSKDCDVSSSNDVMVNENLYMHKLKKHNGVTPDKGANKEMDNSNSGNDTIEENVCTNMDFLKNSREIDKSVIHESLHTDLGEKKLEDIEDVSKVEDVEGSKVKDEEVKIDEVAKKGTHNVSIEEMLGSFVDEVNEDLK